METSGMTGEQIADWLRSHFADFDRLLALEELAAGRARVRYRIGERQLRPGGTVMGPALMLLADTAMYAALLAADRSATDAVTSQLNISFLQRPLPRDLIAEAEVLRRGRTLSVGEVRLYSEGSSVIVAHATVTYSHS
jgi:uncharacterized protein (TIGR00369 family)